MKLKLVLILVGGVAVMFGLGWVPTVRVRNGDTFELTCRTRPRALRVGWGTVESEFTSAPHQRGGAVSPAGGTSTGSTRGLGIGGPSPNDQRSMNPNNPQYQSAMDNRSNQLNPNNPAYRSSRGQQ